jgi:hypothetical protein
MTRADEIRQLSDEELTKLLTWHYVPGRGIHVPNCEEGCSYFGAGCANSCPYNQRENAVRKWLAEEVE